MYEGVRVCHQLTKWISALAGCRPQHCVFEVVWIMLVARPGEETTTENGSSNHESAKVRVICSSCGSAALCQRGGLRIVAARVSAKMSCSPEAPEHGPVGLS